MNISNLIQYANGNRTVDLLLKNARIVNVYSGEIQLGNIAIQNNTIVGIGDYDAKRTEDLEERYVAPGFIDPHVHIESSMAGVPEFACTVAARGTTTVIADPHEIANVLGTGGISYMLRSSENLPIEVLFSLPSCVPASSLETSGAEITDHDLAPFFSHPRVVALAEMMNYPGVVYGNEQVIRKLNLARQYNRIMDGHAPGLSGQALNAYIATGISSDHECTTTKEAKEKLAAGMHIMVREGSAAKNLKDLLPMINHQTFRRMMWCTDDRHPHDLLEQGHLDAVLRKAIGLGLDPIIAIQMATINPASYFGLTDMGAIAPGKKANLVIFSDLLSPIIEQVYFNGSLIAENHRVLSQIEITQPEIPPNSIHADTHSLDFSVAGGSDRIHVIGLIKDQILTNHDIESVSKDRNGFVLPDLSRDIVKIAVVERHKNTGNIGIGFVKGFGLKTGALASSVAHDSHNIIVVGTNDLDMKAAVNEIIHMGGGMAVVNNGLTIAHLELPIAGLMSPEPLDVIRDQLDTVLTAASSIGSVLPDPFIALSFLALPVIPDLKITDKGLVDSKTFKIIPLFAT